MKTYFLFMALIYSIFVYPMNACFGFLLRRKMVPENYEAFRPYTNPLQDILEQFKQDGFRNYHQDDEVGKSFECALKKACDDMMSVFNLSNLQLDVNAEYEGYVPLAIAVEAGDRALIKKLAQRGANPNIIFSYNGLTPLMSIVDAYVYEDVYRDDTISKFEKEYEDHLDTLKAFLRMFCKNKKLEVNKKSARGTALFLACKATENLPLDKQREIANIMRDAGEKPTQEELKKWPDVFKEYEKRHRYKRHTKNNNKP